MTRNRDSRSPRPEEVANHYASGYEANRLEEPRGQIEYLRSRELLERFLPAAPAKVLDVGGAAGAYACWLARRGYEVHLIDIVPRHVELAQEASARQPGSPLASVTIGDACALPWESESVDAALLFGPLYHLTDRNDRIQALSETRRVLKPEGHLFAVGISRFASALDGMRAGYLKDPTFVEIVDRDLTEGQHRNPRNNPSYFMNTFFHHPDELAGELSEAGLSDCRVYGVEGPTWLTPDLNDWWEDEALRERLLQIARRVETEPSLLGTSAHLMAVGRKRR